MIRSGYLFLISIIICLNAYAQQEEIVQEQRTYKTIQGQELKVDIFSAKTTQEQTGNPAIAFFHGGGWAHGTPSEFHEACRRYAKKGFVTFSFQYRLSIKADGKVPHTDITLVECVKDARSAIRWIRGNASELRIDPEKVVVSGQSAGGQLALSTALMDDINEATDNMDISPVPNALMLYSSNVNTMEAWADRLMGDRRKEIWSVSPHHNLKPGMPPAIEFHGKEDCMVPFWVVEHFKFKTTKLGNYFEMIAFEGRGHYLDEDNEKYATYFDESIMERSDEFLEKFGFMPELH